MFKMKKLFHLFLLIVLVVAVNLLVGYFRSSDTEAQSCVPVDPGINDPNAKYCIIANRSTGCPVGFSPFTRVHAIPIYHGQGQGLLQMIGGFQGPYNVWNLSDQYGWHCGADKQDCRENDDDWFMLADYYCCKT